MWIFQKTDYCNFRTPCRKKLKIRSNLSLTESSVAYLKHSIMKENKGVVDLPLFRYQDLNPV